MAHFNLCWASTSGNEIRLPKRREEHAHETGEIDLQRRKWTAKHYYEELKEGIWLEPALSLLRRKTQDEWTDT